MPAESGIFRDTGGRYKYFILFRQRLLRFSAFECESKKEAADGFR